MACLWYNRGKLQALCHGSVWSGVQLDPQHLNKDHNICILVLLFLFWLLRLWLVHNFAWSIPARHSLLSLLSIPTCCPVSGTGTGAVRWQSDDRQSTEKTAAMPQGLDFNCSSSYHVLEDPDAGYSSRSTHLRRREETTDRLLLSVSRHISTQYSVSATMDEPPHVKYQSETTRINQYVLHYALHYGLLYIMYCISIWIHANAQVHIVLFDFGRADG